MTDIDDMKANQLLDEAAKTDEILKYFKYEPVRVTAVRRGFALLALCVVTATSRSPERTVALRKLLEGLDAAERACTHERKVGDR